ncbi:OBSCN [Mytilus coruscus]|uniref:OBSCN n=1 Tax=Mytilus coruscus TaxID=42192 RepID=A0A6J8E8J8_MYTCO|nr:OBSCN [Mytilus coruscus]
MLTYEIFALLFYIGCIIPTQTSVVWKIQTVPIIFGEDVVIKCIVSEDACRSDHTKQWTGGQGYKLIGLNGHTTDKSKYTMNVYKSTLSFELTVKNFSEADANNEYTCLCGKAHYTAILMLNKTEHMFVWKIQTVPIIFGEDVVIKCIVSEDACRSDHTKQWTGGQGYKLIGLNGHTTDKSKYTMNGLTKILRANGNENDNNTFYKIIYEDTTVVHKQCVITWFFNCTFGKESLSTDYQNVYTCNLDYDTDVKPIYELLVIPVIILPLVVIIVYWKCRKSESKSNGK